MIEATVSTADRLIAGIEFIRLIRLGQPRCPKGLSVSAADHFRCLAIN